MIARRAWILIILILLSTGTTVAAQEDKDTTPPVIIMSHPVSIRGISGGGAVDDDCQATVFFEANITDNCCICPENVTVEVIETTGNATLSEPVITKTHSFAPPGFPEGQAVRVVGSVVVSALTSCPATVQVTINATDCEGNGAITAIWTKDVTDETPPEITCPANVEVCDEGLGFATVDPGTATATDNCDPSPQVAGVRSDGKALDDPYPVGTTTITWTATDACGNSSQCDQTVTVWAKVQVPGMTLIGKIVLIALLTIFMVNRKRRYK